MVIKEEFSYLSNTFFGSISWFLLGIGIAIALLLLLAVYIYFAIAWQTIAKKLKFKNSWIAWIPFANWAMILHLGKFHWAWIFLFLIPLVGWIALLVICIIAHWRIFEMIDFPGWFSLSVLIPQVGSILYLIAIGFLAWGRKKKKSRR